MRVWLELTQQEGERLFDMVKEFMVDRKETAVASAKPDKPESAKKDKPEEEAVSEEKGEVAYRSAEELIPIEKVRAVLAEKSQAGKQTQVKDLITQYGVRKLTEIDPASYPQLLKEAEAL